MFERSAVALRLFALSLTLAGGCASTKPVAKPGEVELLAYDGRVTEEAIDHMRLAFPWELKNGTATDAKVDAVEWTLSIEGAELLSGTTPFDVRAAAGATASGVLEIDAEFPSTDESFTARAEKQVLPYGLNAVFKVSQGDATENYLNEWTGEVYAPKKPKLAVQPQAARYEETVELNIVVSVHNGNAFPITLEQLAFTVFVMDTEIFQGTVGQGNQLAPNTEASFDVNRWIGRDDLHDLAKKLAKTKSFPYRVEAELRLDGLSFPQTLTGDITFPR